MDNADKTILTAIQRGLPAAARPFDDLAARLGLGPEDVLARIVRLVERGHIRRIGPVFDSASLGYVSTLVAGRVPPARLREVAERVGRLPGVTHNYERRHAYNLWFTLTSPSREAEAEALERLRRETGIPHFFSLPTAAVYKICVQFDICENGGADAGAPAPPQRPAAPAAAAALTDEQKELVRLIQDGLAVEREPFAAAAARLGWPVERVVEQLREWLACGVIRRFGAVVRHRELGLKANGMAVFRAAGADADEAGRRLASHREVTHCYRRPPPEGFPYNLFAMVHGRSEDEVRGTVARMAADAHLADYDVLFSAAEFKKTSMRYFTEFEAR